MAKFPDQYNSNAPVANADGTAAPFFVQQWNLLLAFIKASLASIASLAAGVAAALAAAQAAAAQAVAAAAAAKAASAPTGVTPGSYTNTNLTVGADGRLTAAANGSSGGGSFSPFYAAVPVTPLYPGSFTLAGATATAVSTTRGVLLGNSAAGGANTFLSLTKPTANFDLKVWGLANPAAARRFLQIQLAISDGTKVVSFGPVTTGGANVPAQLRNINWTNVNTYSSDPVTPPGANDFWPNGLWPFWQRLQYDGTNFIYSMSNDGENWAVCFTTPPSFIAAASVTQVGMFFGTGGSDNPSGATDTYHVFAFTAV